MFINLFRVLMMVICLGASFVAHADARLLNDEINAVIVSSQSERSVFNQEINSNVLSVVNTFHIVTEKIDESSNIEPLFTNAHGATENDLALKTHDTLLVWNFSQPIEKTQRKHSSEGRTYHLGLANSSRQANVIRHDPEEVQPYYELAIELPVPPAPSLVIGYTIQFSDALNWMLNTNSPSSRISGWKESNLTYTRYQQQLSHA
ncbi:hypothetical protein [Photobacterium frigidiphilum]|uniref:hypothetical protein n=1 Tax=Photobacterium frigidiphilum TaxID=264736 RepID=UPI001D1317B6|nr:hypothetical protein [Photobacterium frigidiphilum]